MQILKEDNEGSPKARRLRLRRCSCCHVVRSFLTSLRWIFSQKREGSSGAFSARFDWLSIKVPNRVTLAFRERHLFPALSIEPNETFRSLADCLPPSQRTIDLYFPALANVASQNGVFGSCRARNGRPQCCRERSREDYPPLCRCQSNLSGSLIDCSLTNGQVDRHQPV